MTVARIVVVTHTAQPSGAELDLLRLVQHTRRTDFLVVLGEDGPMRSALSREGAEVVVLRFGDELLSVRRADLRKPWKLVGVVPRALMAMVSLYRFLARCDRTVVVPSSLKAGVLAGPAARVAGATVVWQIHDRLTSDYLSARTAVLAQLAARWIPHAVLVRSETVRRTLELGNKPVGLVPYMAAPPIDHEYIVRPDFNRIGIVGRIDSWKGHEIFIRAFARAFPPPSPVHAVVVGGGLFGNEQLERELRALAQALGVDERVEWRGHRRDVWLEYDRLDAVVHAVNDP